MLSMDFVCDLGAGLAALGQHEEALALVVNALDVQKRGGKFLYVPALFRVKGLILASRSAEDYPEAEKSLLSSIEWARRQSATLFELKSAIDLAELLLSQKRMAEAYRHISAALDRDVRWDRLAGSRSRSTNPQPVPVRRHGCRLERTPDRLIRRLAQSRTNPRNHLQARFAGTAHAVTQMVTAGSHAMSKKVADIIVETLQSAGVRHCYGVVGDTLNLIARSLERSEIEWVSVRHEEAGAFAAQAEAQVAGHLTAVAGSCGPGSLHFINGIFEANRNRAPVVLIASQIIRDELGFDFIQEVDFKQVYKAAASSAT